MTEQSDIELFQYFFTGLNRAYGQWSNFNKAKTVRKSINNEVWKSHLIGVCGLGIIPIQDNNKCKFGVIDIDIDDINLYELDNVIQQKNLPLIVCRSKSGGAHLYHFVDPAIPAVKLRKRLADWAGQLGFGKSEIFPKQEKLINEEIGNWINLPYFNCEETNRYAVLENKQLLFHDFIKRIKQLISSHEIIEKKELPLFPEMPPCLVSLFETGIPKGFRNEAMYNYTVYLRKSAPESWEDSVHKLNHNSFNPPLSIKEVNSVIKSVNKKDYNYKCTSAPIDMFCNRIACLTKQFGVKNVTDVYNDVMVGSITKVLTDPPRWVVEINGIDLTLTTEEMMNYSKVRLLCLEKIDIVVPPLKVEEWLKIIKDRLVTKTVVAAPEDTGIAGPILAALSEFLSMYDRAKNKEDIMRGIPVLHKVNNESMICFRSYDFTAFMAIKKMVQIPGPNLWMMLRSYGCGHTKMKIAGKAVQVWYSFLSNEGKISLTPVNEEVEI